MNEKNWIIKYQNGKKISFFGTEEKALKYAELYYRKYGNFIIYDNEK